MKFSILNVLGKKNRNTVDKPDSKSFQNQVMNRECGGEFTDTFKQKLEPSDVEGVFQSGTTIFQNNRLPDLIRSLKELVGLSDDNWNDYYFPVLVNAAEICQHVEASESYHHSYRFGLIEHLLEVATYALRCSERCVYMPDGNVESISLLERSFKYSVFCASIIHDLGKVITDYQWYIWNGRSWVAWSSIYMEIPSEDRKVKFKAVRRKSSDGMNAYYKNSHELIASAMLNEVIPGKGLGWIISMSDKVSPLFFSHFLHACSSDYAHASEIGICVKEGDALSTAISNKAQKRAGGINSVSEEESPNLPLHENFRIQFQRMLSSPDGYGFIVNGAVSGKYSHIERFGELFFCSAKTFISVACSELKNKGIKLPNEQSVYKLLCDNDVAVPTPQGDTLWWAKFVNLSDENGKKAQKELSYVVLRRDQFSNVNIEDLSGGDCDIRFSEKVTGSDLCVIDKDSYPEYHALLYGNKKLINQKISDHETISSVSEPLDSTEATNIDESMVDNSLFSTANLALPESKPTNISAPSTEPSKIVTPVDEDDSLFSLDKLEKPGSIAAVMPENIPEDIPSRSEHITNSTDISEPKKVNLDAQEFKDKLVISELTESAPYWLRPLYHRKKRADFNDVTLVHTLFPFIEKMLELGKITANRSNSAIHYTKYGLFIVTPQFFECIKESNRKKYRNNIKRSGYCLYAHKNISTIAMQSRSESDSSNIVYGFLLNYHELKINGMPLPVNLKLELCPPDLQTSTLSNPDESFNSLFGGDSKSTDDGPSLPFNNPFGEDNRLDNGGSIFSGPGTEELSVLSKDEEF